MSLICMRMNPAGNTFSQKWFYKKNRFDTGLKSLCHNDFQYKASSWFPFFFNDTEKKAGFLWINGNYLYAYHSNPGIKQD